MLERNPVSQGLGSPINVSWVWVSILRRLSAKHLTVLVLPKRGALQVHWKNPRKIDSRKE